jgi:hypothetical protein
MIGKQKHISRAEYDSLFVNITVYTNLTLKEEHHSN